MKKHKIILINFFSFIIVLGLICSVFLFLHNHITFIESIEFFIYYYRSFDNIEKSNVYIFINNIIWVFLLLYFIIIYIIKLLTKRIIIVKQFKNYPTIIKEYHGYFYFILFGLLFVFNSLLIIFNTFNINIFYNIIFFIPLPLVLEVVGDKKYNYVNLKIKKVKENNFNIIETVKPPTKQYRVIHMFYIILIISIITIGCTISKLVSYNNCFSYPNELIINEKTAYSIENNPKYICNQSEMLYCYFFAEFFKNYELNNIEIIINSENFITILDNSDYQILIKNDNNKYYLTSDNFTLEKSNGEYKFFIKNLNDLNMTSFNIKFINPSSLETVENQKFSSYKITLKKL